MGPIDVTVAAVVERHERYLLVEEHAAGQRVFNQPAGHVEPGESLVQAVIRETREETGLRFNPAALLGVYLWPTEDGQRSFLRIAFSGSVERHGPARPLDQSIIAAHWLERTEILDYAERLRSPMVLRCIDDYRAGIRYPLECLTDLTGLALARGQSIRSSRTG